MKKNLTGLILILMTVAIFSVGVFSQTTEFTYQGNLQNGGVAATGVYDFEFLLFNAVTGGTQNGSTLTRSGVTVTNGIFSVKLDFGANFPGADRFLEIHVKQVMGGSFTPLTPRQAVTSVPYSVTSLTAGNVTGVVGVANGGTGSNTNPSPDKFLRGNGTAWIASRLDPTDIPAGNTEYIQNIGVGTQAASFNINGSGNANLFNATTQYNIAGARFLSTAGTNNTFAGLGAGNPSDNSANNSFFGSLAGTSNLGGFNNSFFGASAGAGNTNGQFNSFFGSTAGQNNIAGFHNSFFGGSAGQNNGSGSKNSFFGINAGVTNTSGNQNTMIGHSANVSAGNLFNATAIGANAFVSQSNSLVLGSINTVNGAITDTYVGIGVSAPLFKLQVKTGTDQNLAVRPGSAFNPALTGIGLQSVNDANNQYKSLDLEGSQLTLNVGSGGNVGVGLTTPAEKLHVAGGNVRWANSILSEQQGGSLELGGTDTIAGTGTPFIDFHVNGSTGDYNVRLINDLPGRLNITASLLKTSGLFQAGDLGTGGFIPLCFSDIYVLSVCGSSLRYKQNVNPFVSGLSLIKQLRPVTFNWIANNQADMGLVAEEVAKVEPLLTTTNNKGEIEGVKYDRVGVVLVNAVNEQQLQIEAQQKQIDEQNEIITKQRADLDTLKALVCSQNPTALACKPQN